MYDVSNTIGRIKQLAKEKGITMTYLCHRLNKRATFLADVRIGNDSIDEAELAIIAAELGTTPEYLKGEVATPERENSYISKIEKSPVKQDFAKILSEMSDEDVLVMANMYKQFKGGK